MPPCALAAVRGFRPDRRRRGARYAGRIRRRCRRPVLAPPAGWTPLRAPERARGPRRRAARAPDRRRPGLRGRRARSSTRRTRSGVANLTAQLLTRGTATRSAPRERPRDRVRRRQPRERRRPGLERARALRAPEGPRARPRSPGRRPPAARLPATPSSSGSGTRSRRRCASRRRTRSTVAARVAAGGWSSRATRTAARRTGPRPRSAPSPGTMWSAFHRVAYRPERTIVAVAGDVTAAAVRTELEARLGAWSGAGPRRRRPAAAALGLPSRTEAVQRSLTQATILLGQATVTRKHPDFYPLARGEPDPGRRLVLAPVHAGPRGARPRVQRVRAVRAGPPRGPLPGRAPDRERADPRGAGGGPRGAGPPASRAGLGGGAGPRALVPDRELPAPDGHGGRGRRTSWSRSSGSTSASTIRRASGRPCAAVTADDVLRAVRTHWDPDAMSLALVGDLREAGIGNP